MVECMRKNEQTNKVTLKVETYQNVLKFYPSQEIPIFSTNIFFLAFLKNFELKIES